MSDHFHDGPNWQVLDTATVAGLAGQDEEASETAQSQAVERADRLAALAVAGKVADMKAEIVGLRAWASRLGLRRIENTVIELDRVLGLSSRGDAIFQAQALTRFIRLHVADDLRALGKAIKAI